MGIVQKFQDEDLALFEAIKEYQNGNKDKSTYIYESTKKYTYRIVHQYVSRFKSQGVLTGDEHTITEDVMQDLYLSFFHNIAKFRNEDPKSIYKWISIVSHRMVLDYVDKNKMEVLQYEKDKEFREESDIWDFSEINDSDLESNREMLPEAAFEDKEFRQLILDFIQSLPEAQAQTILLHFSSEMKYQEIADEMGVSLITVKTRMKKAKDALEEVISKYEKKTGTKLRSVSVLPMLWILYRLVAEETVVPVAVDAAVTSSLFGSSGVMVTGVGSVTVTSTTKAIGTKVLIGIVSAIVTIGGVLGISQLNREDTVEPPVIEEPQRETKEFNSDYFKWLMYLYWSEDSANVETKDIAIEKFTEFVSCLLVEDNVLDKEIKQSDEAKYVEVTLKELTEFYTNTLGCKLNEDTLNQIYERENGLYKVWSQKSDTALVSVEFEILKKDEEAVVLSGSYDINGESGKFEMHGQKQPESYLGGYVVDSFYFTKGQEEAAVEKEPVIENEIVVEQEEEALICPRCSTLIDTEKTPYTSTDWQGNVYNIYQCLSCYKLIEKCPKCEDGYFRETGITTWGGNGMKCDSCGHTVTEICIENCPHCNAHVDNYTKTVTYSVLFNSEPVTGLANRYYQSIQIQSVICTSCNKYIIGETVKNYDGAYEILKGKLSEDDDIFQYIHWEKKNSSGEYESMGTPRISSTSELEGQNEF